MTIKFYENSIWVLDNNIWRNYTKAFKTDPQVIEVIARKFKYTKKVAKDFVLDAKADMDTQVDKDILIAFTNGYINKKNVFIHGAVPFTTSQLDLPYIEDAPTHPELERYLSWFTDSDINKRKSLLAMSATLFTLKNEGAMGILYSKMGGTGKTQLLSLFKEIGRKVVKPISTKIVFNHDGKFNLTGSTGKTGLIGDELPTKILKGATDEIKNLIDPGKKYREYEDKHSNSDETNNFLNMIISTNRISSWHEVDHALKSRVNVIYIAPDQSYIFSEDDFYALREDEDALISLLSMAVKYYMEAQKSPEFRAKKYAFGLEDSEKYWDEVENTHSAIIDFLEHEYSGERLIDKIMDKKEDFIPTSWLKQAKEDWFKTSRNNITLRTLKNGIVKWGSNRGLIIDSKVKKNNTWGMAIMSKEIAIETEKEVK